MNTMDPLLIVEDVPNILDFLEVTLKFKGYEVLKARNGQEALDAMQKQRPALIITDILMPKMDGFTLLYHLRTDLSTREIPVVFLSATYIAPEDKAFAMAIGATRFLEKPIDTEEFLLTDCRIVDTRIITSACAFEGTRVLDGISQAAGNEASTKEIHKSPALKRLLETLPPEQKPGFVALRQQSINDREEIQTELDFIKDFLGKE